MFGINKKVRNMINIAKGLGLLQEAYDVYESLKADGTLKEVEEALHALQVAYEKNPEVKELLEKISQFKLEG